ncbi:diguanylate cyclase [Pseudolysobacter antarcticus]|uniref:Diguanylate cyclase n=1 Tax=Pseudolysobacter antarcticus TaxID=2511995 RepID=A0A411HJU0_9GAMM|nr:sensor domain-containing diguanylate cyclase [Pseudolysobacter antarcticus]QBB70785.1 diguanylate cyclase [Pseudolysobacter antarcticus]
MTGWNRIYRWVHVNPRLLLIIWPFLVAVLILLLLATTSIQIVSSTRAYVGGESIWSKAQKEAVYHLYRYAQSHDDTDYNAFLTAIAIPEGDHAVRIELEKPSPDLVIARNGFLAGQNHPDDIDGMIWLFRRFRRVSFLDKAIELWAKADPLIADLHTTGEKLHAQVRAGDATPQSLEPILAEIQRINAEVTPLATAFSDTLGEASRLTQQGLKIFLTMSALLLVVAGIYLSRRMQRRNDAFEQALRLSEERYNLAINGSNDGIWDWELPSNKIYYSPQVNDFLGREGLDSYTTTEAFLEILHKDDRESVLLALRNHLTRDTTYDVEFRALRNSGDHRWLRMRGNAIRDTKGQPTRMAGSISDITDRKLAEVQLRYQASHDALTGLINRHEFEHRLSLLIAKTHHPCSKHAVLYLDLDQFRAINDSYGPRAGDEVLRQVGAVLHRHVPEGHTVARLGDAEFGVLMENCPPDAAHEIAEELRQAIDSFEFVWREFTFNLTASIGLARVGDGLNSLAEIMSAADTTRFVDKERGRNRVNVFIR